MVYIFFYNVIYIKSDFSRLKQKLDNQKFVLVASPYCLKHLTVKNRNCFEKIHQISRDFHEIDYNEIEQIVKHYIKEYGASNIRLMTNEDSTHLACAKLCEIYGIPGHKIDTLLPFVDKVVSKTKLGNTVRLPKFIKFDKKAYQENKTKYLNTLIEYLGFPMFAKPVDLVSSVETHYIGDLECLNKIADRIMLHPYEFEIDEYIEGELFHCDAMIINGEVKFFMIGKCSFALARFFEGKPVGSIPINNQEKFNELQEFCHKVFKKLNCPDGAYHMEAFLEQKTNEFVFLEIGARTGGALITKVYEKLFDLNIEETNYLIQLGLLKDIPASKKDIFAGFLNFPKIKGSVNTIKKPNINIDHEFIEFVEKGENISQAENLLDISCSIIFWDKSYKKVEDAFEYLKNCNPLILNNHPETQTQKNLPN
jgi:D-alanine-D-alanine ligase-like ATP-grasp enzyme